jgi:hypothetical protein
MGISHARCVQQAPGGIKRSPSSGSIGRASPAMPRRALGLSNPAFWRTSRVKRTMGLYRVEQGIGVLNADEEDECTIKPRWRPARAGTKG